MRNLSYESRKTNGEKKYRLSKLVLYVRESYD